MVKTHNIVKYTPFEHVSDIYLSIYIYTELRVQLLIVWFRQIGVASPGSEV